MKANVKSWAEREIDIVCNQGVDDYFRACCQSALKAYRSLTKDGHSGNSIAMTKYILNRLIDRKPLSNIVDTEDAWNDVTEEHCNCTLYQCKRMSKLFKHVYPDGSVKYIDHDRFHGVSIDSPDISYHSGLIDRIMHELSPIAMPYFPSSEPTKVVCEDFLTDEKNGDFDTVGMLYFIDLDGCKVEINRYFKESENGYDEIDKEEYEERRVMHNRRLENSKENT